MVDATKPIAADGADVAEDYTTLEIVRAARLVLAAAEEQARKYDVYVTSIKCSGTPMSMEEVLCARRHHLEWTFAAARTEHRARELAALRHASGAAPMHYATAAEVARSFDNAARADCVLDTQRGPTAAGAARKLDVCAHAPTGRAIENSIVEHPLESTQPASHGQLIQLRAEIARLRADLDGHLHDPVCGDHAEQWYCERQAIKFAAAADAPRGCFLCEINRLKADVAHGAKALAKTAEALHQHLREQTPEGEVSTLEIRHDAAVNADAALAALGLCKVGGEWQVEHRSGIESGGA